VGVVSLEELTEGMVLSRPAVSPQGRLLAPGGTCVEARHLRLFRMWGVTEIVVEGVTGRLIRPPRALDEADRALIERSVARRFEGVLDHPAMIEMARAATEMAVEREARRRG
jgi:hypothetical protein